MVAFHINMTNSIQDVPVCFETTIPDQNELLFRRFGVPYDPARPPRLKSTTGSNSRENMSTKRPAMRHFMNSATFQILLPLARTPPT